jgi:tetratricopeptide (TPR) repeat protein
MNLYIFGFFVLTVVFFGITLFVRSWQYPVRIKKAEEYLENGEDTKASEIVREILDKRKDYVPARYLRAKLLKKQKQYLMSISEMRGIFQIPDYTKYVKELEIHYHLAELYNLTQQWGKEIEEYKIIISFNPNDVNANHRIGHSYYKQNNFKEARTALFRAVTLDPKLSDCFLPLGVSFFHMAEYDNAEQYLLKTTEVDRDNHEAYFFLGLIYKGKKDYENAIIMFEKSRAKKSYYMKSLYQTGLIYFETEYYDKVIAALQDGLGSLKSKDDESLAYRYLLAEAYEMENQIKDAVHHWEIIQQEKPNYRNTKTKLEDYLIIMSDDNLESLFTTSLEDLQPFISELIALLNYNVISKEYVSANKILYKAFNIKRINEPPVLICFDRSTREISESKMNEFYQQISDEKCKTGIYMSTARFSKKAQSIAASKMIELLDKDYLAKANEKISKKSR